VAAKSLASPRRGDPGTFVIAMTGVEYANFDPLRIALELGADGALKKPITPDNLSAEIARLTADRK
jgi:hypothetical protein